MHTLRGHDDMAFAVTFDPTGQMLASAGSLDENVILWSTEKREFLRNLGTHKDGAFTVAFDYSDGTLFSGGNDSNIKVWNPINGELLFKLVGHNGSVNCIAFDSENHRLASGSLDSTIRIWDVKKKELLHTLRGHRSSVLTVAVASTKHIVASGNQDETIRLWDIITGKLIRVIEGHTGMLQSIAFSANGELLVSKSADGFVRVWNTDTGSCLATIAEPTRDYWAPGVAFHPKLPVFATVGSDPDRSSEKRDRDIHIYELDLSVLLGLLANPTVTYTSAKIVLVGDSGAAKRDWAGGWRITSSRSMLRHTASSSGH